MTVAERRRRSSAVPSGNESFDGGGSVVEELWTKESTNVNGLHHRHVTRSRSESSEQEDSERGVVSKQRLQHYHRVRKRRRYLSAKCVRSCLVMGIPAYLVLIVLFLKRVNQQQNLNFHDVYVVRTLQDSTVSKLLNRLERDSQEWELSTIASSKHRDLVISRRQRVKPFVLQSDGDHDLSTTTLWGMDRHERPETTFESDDDPRPGLVRTATLDEICGFQSKNAALEQPESFLYRDALNMPKSRVTRVLITGALSQVGYLLALALKERCNVQVVIAFDSMYPNSIRNRLRLHEQMAILTKNIPKLVKPIFLSHLGLDPVKHSKNFKVLESTQEMDILKTLTPTHIVHLGSYEPHAFRYSSPNWKDDHSPYVTENRDSSLFALRSGVLSMEQILQAIAAAPINDRPHLIYAGRSFSSDNTMHQWSRSIDEVLADYYYQAHGIYSASIRLPNAIFGSWGHPESILYSLFDQSTRAIIEPTTNTTDKMVFSSDVSNLDLLHADDIVDGLVAAMQYRPEDSKPTYFEFSAGALASLEQIQTATQQILNKSSPLVDVSPHSTINNEDESMQRVKDVLGWAPRVSLGDGLVRTLAWHMDHLRPYGKFRTSSTDTTETTETGDLLLERYMIPRCKAEDLSCHSGRPFLPCASECSIRDNCIPTIFDELVPKVKILSEECDIVLYTQDFDRNTQDLDLHSEFMDEGNPLVCNFAFVNGDSGLVNSVMDRVPESELVNLGFEMTAEDERIPGGMRASKLEKLNGRLLYRGWILVWTLNTPDVLSAHEEYFLKLSPGRLFHGDVKTAVFIDQTFGVSPRADDIEFLAYEMHRPYYGPKVVKRKTRPKAKFLLPAEPERKAVVLMSELKYQDSSEAERLSPDEKISSYEATRFMRYSNGEEPLGKESHKIKLQREFYDRLRTSINPDHARAPSEPVHKFELKRWVRSRWVAHDLTEDESRLLRCEWYQEHVLWEAGLDQLSFAYIMEKMEISRKLARNEIDDTVQKQLAEKIEMKNLLSDTFEWHALDTEQNCRYSPFEEMKILPFELDYIDNGRDVASTIDGVKVPLFARIISDRIMAFARKAWNERSKTGGGSEL